MTTVRGLKYKTYTDWVDLIPKFEKQAAEYRKVTLPTDPRYGKGNKGEVQEPQHYPYNKNVTEYQYVRWTEQVVNEKTKKFFPAKNDENRAIEGTGAWITVNSISRIKLADGSQYLVSKKTLHGYNALGEEITCYIPFSEVWNRILFSYKTKIDDKTMQFEKVFDGVKGNEEEYDLAFTKENLKELWDSRESDLIRLVVKDETGKAVEVSDVTGNPMRSMELFRDSYFNYLFKGDYISPQEKANLRQSAIADGFIKGNISDFSEPAPSSDTNTKIYK